MPPAALRAPALRVPSCFAVFLCALDITRKRSHHPWSLCLQSDSPPRSRDNHRNGGGGRGGYGGGRGGGYNGGGFGGPFGGKGGWEGGKGGWEGGKGGWDGGKGGWDGGKGGWGGG